MEWIVELVLAGLLAATLFHAVRLERALGVLKRDRATLEALVEGFNRSTRQAETGIERLRAAADGAGKQIARQAEQARSLADDLSFLTERGEKLADRLDRSVRAARQSAPSDIPAYAPGDSTGGSPGDTPPAAPEPDRSRPKPRSQAEQDLLKILRMAR